VQPHARVPIATVLIARSFFAAAEQEIDAAIQALATRAAAGESGTAVAVYWLKGLLCLLLRGDIDEAIAMCERELALEACGHLYAKECCASALYVIGVCHLLRGDKAAALSLFDQSLARVPGHAMVFVGRIIAGAPMPAGLRSDVPMSVDVAAARAAGLRAIGNTAAGAVGVGEALSATPPRNAGWLIPIDRRSPRERGVGRRAAATAPAGRIGAFPNARDCAHSRQTPAGTFVAP